MSADESTITEFQKRRRATWHAIRWWLLIGVAAIVALVMLSVTNTGAFDDKQINAGLLMILLFVGCAAAVALQVRRLYRCPRCNAVPMRTTPGWYDKFGKEGRDVEWNPSECPTCRAPLR